MDMCNIGLTIKDHGEIPIFEIHVKYMGMNLTMIPEIPEMFLDSNFPNDINSNIKFESGTLEGEFNIDVSEDIIEFTLFEAALGLLTLRIPRTPKLSQDLANVAVQISEYIHNHPEYLD